MYDFLFDFYRHAVGFAIVYPYREKSSQHSEGHIKWEYLTFSRSIKKFFELYIENVGYFKIMNNLTIINPAEFFMFGDVGVTRGHGFKLQKRLLHNNRLSNIFTNRAVDCWNSLPNKIVYAEF